MAGAVAQARAGQEAAGVNSRRLDNGRARCTRAGVRRRSSFRISFRISLTNLPSAAPRSSTAIMAPRFPQETISSRASIVTWVLALADGFLSALHNGHFPSVPVVSKAPSTDMRRALQALAGRHLAVRDGNRSLDV
jgi:hypothetical protein